MQIQAENKLVPRASIVGTNCHYNFMVHWALLDYIYKLKKKYQAEQEAYGAVLSIIVYLLISTIY